MDHCPTPCDGNEQIIAILSIDGGGMRGVIPAYILTVLEAELQVYAFSIGNFFFSNPNAYLILYNINFIFVFKNYFE